MLFLVKLNPELKTLGQSNFGIGEEKDYYRVVSETHLSFDCRSYCGRGHRMQEKCQ